MTLVQTVYILKKDKWEQNGGGRKKKRHLVKSEKTKTNSSTLPTSKQKDKKITISGSAAEYFGWD